MSSREIYDSDFRNILEVLEGGEPRGDMAATNTGVFRLGMNKRADWNSRNTNKRKGFIEENHWWNLLAVRKNPIEFVNEDEIEISGVSLKDINRELRKEENGVMTVVNSGPGKDAIRHDESDMGVPRDSLMPRMVDAGLKIINPNGLIRLTGNKAEQNRVFSDLGFVPHWALSDNYSDEGGIEELEARLQPFEDVPIISKPIGASGGDGIEFRHSDELIEDLEYESERRDIDGALNGYIFQAALPVSGDVRVISAGDTPITAEIRYGRPDIDLHNLGQMEDGTSQFELVENGAAESVNIDDLDEAYLKATRDIHEELVRQGFIDGENTELWLGHDFLKVDPEDDPHDIIGSYPEAALDQIFNEDYKTEDGCYLVFAETNSSPGYKIDHINHEYPHQNSAINLVKAADDFSRGLEFDPLSSGDLHPDDRELIDSRYSPP